MTKPTYVCSNMDCGSVTENPNTKINKETTAAGLSFPTTILICPNCGSQVVRKTLK